MINEQELRRLMTDLEAENVERTRAFNKIDKMEQAICAFANDFGNRRTPGYLLLGVEDDGRIAGRRVTDDDLLSIGGLKTEGNLLPQPSMAIERFQLPEGDVVVVEVYPSHNLPIRFKGLVWIRIGPRKALATENDIHLLNERRLAYGIHFEEMPCMSARIEDLNLDLFKSQYLPQAIKAEIIDEDDRDIQQQLCSLRFYDRNRDCPTNLGMILFGKHPEMYIPCSYIQYVRFEGDDNGGEILQEYAFRGPLISRLPEIDVFVKTSLAMVRPVRISSLREKNVARYPVWACRELILNAIIHRDYQMGNAPIKIYEYSSGRLEISNSGGLYGQSAENFPYINDYRNPRLAESMKVLGYVNKFNRGIAKVKLDLQDNGNPDPDFEAISPTVFCVKLRQSKYWKKSWGLKKTILNKGENGTVNVSVKSGDVSVNQEKVTVNQKNGTVNQEKVTVKSDDVSVNPGDVSVKSGDVSVNPKMIIDAIKSTPAVTQKLLAEQFHLTTRQIARIMKTLRENGRLRRVGSDKTGHWEVIEQDVD